MIIYLQYIILTYFSFSREFTLYKVSISCNKAAIFRSIMVVYVFYLWKNMQVIDKMHTTVYYYSMYNTDNEITNILLCYMLARATKKVLLQVVLKRKCKRK